ncbi:hypothetical protein F5884DRAFT_758635 [Xylogone sp. PMI_703]|nr:hypothetical protein F5884DRAFT_758635 [Xylogone sp. PMI_703]
MQTSPESGSEINVRITPPMRNSPEYWFDAETNIQTSIEAESSTTTAIVTVIQSTDLIINRLMPIKDLGIVDQRLWSDIDIPETTKQVTLTLAAREASTSQRIGIS